MEELLNYILNEFEGRHYISQSYIAEQLVRNAVAWVYEQQMDREDKITTLLSLLKGLYLKREKIESFF